MFLNVFTHFVLFSQITLSYLRNINALNNYLILLLNNQVNNIMFLTSKHISKKIWSRQYLIRVMLIPIETLIVCTIYESLNWDQHVVAYKTWKIYFNKTNKLIFSTRRNAYNNSKCLTILICNQVSLAKILRNLVFHHLNLLTYSLSFLGKIPIKYLSNIDKASVE